VCVAARNCTLDRAKESDSARQLRAISRCGEDRNCVDDYLRRVEPGSSTVGGKYVNPFVGLGFPIPTIARVDDVVTAPRSLDGHAPILVSLPGEKAIIIFRVYRGRGWLPLFAPTETWNAPSHYRLKSRELRWIGSDKQRKVALEHVFDYRQTSEERMATVLFEHDGGAVQILFLAPPGTRSIGSRSSSWIP